MNVTLSLEDELVKTVRKIAVDRDTTMTAMIRDYLKQIVASADAKEAERKRQQLDALERSFEECKFYGGPHTWTRADLYDRTQK